MRLAVLTCRLFDEPATFRAELDRLTARLDKKKLVVLLDGQGERKLAEAWCFQSRVNREHWYEGLDEMMAGAGAVIVFRAGTDRRVDELVKLARKHKRTMRFVGEED
jgi:hypothetical protein